MTLLFSGFGLVALQFVQVVFEAVEPDTGRKRWERTGNQFISPVRGGERLLVAGTADKPGQTLVDGATGRTIGPGSSGNVMSVDDEKGTALLLQFNAPFGQRQRLFVTMLHQRDVGLIAANGGEDVAGFNEQRQPLRLGERRHRLVEAAFLRQRNAGERMDHRQVSAIADEKWSIGPLTLPHMLVRLVVAEQLYRAAAMLANHPYHRA